MQWVETELVNDWNVLMSNKQVFADHFADMHQIVETEFVCQTAVTIKYNIKLS